MTVVATDVTQRLREAIVEALDSHASIVAITNRSSENVVPARDRGTAQPPQHSPRIAYSIITAVQLGGSGDRWRCRVQFSGFAANTAAASQLVETVNRVLTSRLLLGLTTSPVEATIVDRSRNPGPTEEGAEHEHEILELVMDVQQPTL